MKQKIIIGIIILIIIVAVVVIYFMFPQKETVIPLTTSYDINKDYCGKAVDIHYCQCAFEDESFCKIIGIDSKETASNLVNAGFENWVNQQKERECIEKGGILVGNICKKKEKINILNIFK